MIGKILQPRTGLLRTKIGSAEDEEGNQYELSTSMAGSPILYSRKTEKYFVLSWEEIFSLAIEAGINQEES